ncbi:MAG: HupE/UreJ family protein, partial [Vicinamibacterales bacterium]|nr:HupE/UreJ family protein [Vicinamibacterales bacterium]
MDVMCAIRKMLLVLVLAGAAVMAMEAPLDAHPMEGSNAGFVQSVDGPAPGPFLYLGAKHMVTGYDHLLFLVGVIFFLYRLKDVVLYVSLFTLGHSLTLLVGVLADVSVNAYVIDAIIGLSVVYKGFENINGFERVFNVK